MCISVCAKNARVYIGVLFVGVCNLFLVRVRVGISVCEHLSVCV